MAYYNHNIQYVHFYTDGSAARKLEPVTPFKKNTVRMPAQKKRKHKLIYVDPVAVLGICVAIFMVVMMAVGLTQFSKVKAERETMTAYVHYLEQENQILTEKYAQSYDLNEIENTAKALGMIPQEQVKTVAIHISEP